MISTRTLKLLSIVLGITMLAACGDSKISAVKDSRLQGAEFTFGENLDKIKECKSTDWSSELVNNFTIVTHTCKVKVDEALIESAKKAQLEAVKVHARLKEGSAGIYVRGAQTVHAGALHTQELQLAQLAMRVADADRQVSAVANSKYSRFVSLSGTALRGGEAPPDPAAWEAKRAENLAQVNAAREKVLAEVDAQKQKLQLDVDEAFKAVGAALGWQDKLKEAVEQTSSEVAKEVEAYYAKDHSIEVRTSFRYREGANAELVRSALFIDDQEGREGIAVYLWDPKRMREYLTYFAKKGFLRGANELFDSRFPIEREGPNGFKYKEQASAK